MPLYQAPTSGNNGLLQTLIVEVTANTTTTSTVDVILMTTSVTTSGGKLALLFDVSCSNTTANAMLYFDLVVDGTVVRSCGVRYTNTPAIACGLNDVVVVAAGSHTVAVQWHVSAGTGQIRPVAAPMAESASLVIMEVLVV